ncbi:unnamed protein product [Adineta steineri]|uniref:Uncharacterized protein n=1 Tax=Adineta steineri TaxID=433720 RepID=A0A815MA04_9BILA|nr:unnamed protein product [Adineta steineri]CAF1620351.1 unnamed protein product [Adineta steineri]
MSLASNALTFSAQNELPDSRVNSHDVSQLDDLHQHDARDNAPVNNNDDMNTRGVRDADIYHNGVSYYNLNNSDTCFAYFLAFVLTVLFIVSVFRPNNYSFTIQSFIISLKEILYFKVTNIVGRNVDVFDM